MLFILFRLLKHYPWLKEWIDQEEKIMQKTACVRRRDFERDLILFDGNTTLHLRTFSWIMCRSQWPRGLRRRSAAARQLGSWVRIPPGAWIFVGCECCVLSSRGLCYELITRPDEFYWLWCVVMCDLENLKNEEAMTRVGTQRHSKKKKVGPCISTQAYSVSAMFSDFIVRCGEHEQIRVCCPRHNKCRTAVSSSIYPRWSLGLCCFNP